MKKLERQSSVRRRRTKRLDASVYQRRSTNGNERPCVGNLAQLTSYPRQADSKQVTPRGSLHLVPKKQSRQKYLGHAIISPDSGLAVPLPHATPACRIGRTARNPTPPPPPKDFSTTEIAGRGSKVVGNAANARCSATRSCFRVRTAASWLVPFAGTGCVEAAVESKVRKTMPRVTVYHVCMYLEYV